MSVSRGGTKSSPSSDDILRNITKGTKPRFLSCFSYQGLCFFIIILFVALVFYLVINLAKTGLVSIPIISNVFYHEPQPIEVVSSQNSFKLDSVINLNDITKSEFNFNLTQEDLTSLVQSNDQFSSGQIAIGELTSELFVQKNIFDKNVYFTINFIPRVKNNKLDFQITKAKIGELSIPVILANFGKNIFMQSLNSQLSILNSAKISKVETKKGQMTIFTEPLSSKKY